MRPAPLEEAENVPAEENRVEQVAEENTPVVVVVEENKRGVDGFGHKARQTCTSYRPSGSCSCRQIEVSSLRLRIPVH